jgi:UrcA family protein
LSESATNERENHQEIDMHIKTAVITARCLLGAAAVACTLLAGNAVARDHEVTVQIHVSTQGLDLSQPAGAKEFYGRLEYAAYVACTRGDRVGLAPATDPKGCYEQSLADAIRSINRPMVIQAYLAKHTIREASVHGIAVPAEIAAK